MAKVRSGRAKAVGMRLRPRSATKARAKTPAKARSGKAAASLSGKKPGKSARSARKLLESERGFRLLVEGVVDYAIYMLDPTGIIANWNSGAERIKGYKAKEVVGRHFGMFYTPEDRAAGLPIRSLETARRKGRFAAEGWRMRKDGTRFFASVVIDAIYQRGRLIGFAKITRDITERQAAKVALQDSQRDFRRLISAVTDYAVYMLDTEGHVSSWNAGGERIKGYQPGEIIGQHFSRFYSETDRANGKPARALSIAREAGRYEEEGWRVRKDGSFFWASVVIDPIHDDDGELIGFAKVTRDITERRDAALALEKLQRQLAESQKMDALGQLTGGVAHDFNNLLMIVTGHLHALKRIARDDPKGSRAVQAIEVASQRGAHLTRQLLTFARRQHVNPSTVDLRSRIESIREVLGSGLGGNIRLVIDIPDVAWRTAVDVNELEVALVNLVVNARDAMPDGGTVTITAANTHLEEEPALAAGDYVALAVKDTGVGIPPDVLGKVFDPFFTTKPVGKGTGLGLSQVHGFVHQAGGTVRVTSSLGEGTTITLYLPRLSDREQGSTVNGAESHKAGAGTVLLVEDNPEVANASAGLIEQLGYAVRWVPTAEAALRELENDGIDLVFSDVVMPGLDGLGLARIVRRLRPRLPILLATGYSEAAQRVHTDFPILRKPYDLHELGRVLANLLRA